MARVHAELYDKTRDRLFSLGNYNEGKKTRTELLWRVYERNRLDKLECIPDYSIVLDGEYRISLDQIRRSMIT